MYVVKRARIDSQSKFHRYNRPSRVACRCHITIQLNEASTSLNLMVGSRYLRSSHGHNRLVWRSNNELKSFPISCFVLNFNTLLVRKNFQLQILNLFDKFSYSPNSEGSKCEKCSDCVKATKIGTHMYFDILFHIRIGGILGNAVEPPFWGSNSPPISVFLR